MLRCAADNTNLPPERGWADLAGDPAPAGFKVSAGEDGRSVNVLTERSRAVEPQGTPGAGQTESPQKGGEAVKQSSDGSATEQPPSAGAAPSDSQVVRGEAQETRKGEEDAAAEKERADGAQPASDLSSAAPRGGDGEEDTELDTAELDKWVIDRRPPNVPEEHWRELSRPQQDELFKEWKTKHPEEGCQYDQYILAWFARQDMLKKRRAQEADARCRSAQERKDAAAASAAPPREEKGGETVALLPTHPRPPAACSEPSSAPPAQLPAACPRESEGAELARCADETMSLTDARDRDKLRCAINSAIQTRVEGGEGHDEVLQDVEQLIAAIARQCTGGKHSAVYFPCRPGDSALGATTCLLYTSPSPRDLH